MKSSVIRAGATLDRNVKTSGHLVLGRNARLEGSAIVLGNLTLGPGAVIEGRVSVEGDLVMGARSRIDGEAEVTGAARLLPGATATKIVAKNVELRGSRADEVYARGNLTLVDAQVDTFEARGKVIAKR